MNPTDPNELPDATDPAKPKPWQPQQPGLDTGGPVSGGDDAGIAGIVGGAADAAGGALDAVGGVADAASGVLEGAGGCLEGCSCSVALALMLTAAAGTAFALLR
jgi:hypothetical protein